MDKLIGVAIVIAILVFIFYLIAYVLMGIGFIVFVIPFYIFFILYVVLEFISTNVLIVLDKIFYPGFYASPVVVWAFWGLVIGAAIQGYREMNIYGRREKGMLIALTPVALLAILKLISPPMSGSIGVYSVSSPVTPPRLSSPPPVRNNDHSNTRSGATNLSLGSSRSGQIRPGSDIDYFKIQVSKSGVLTVYTTGSLDTRGTLQNSSGTSLVRNLDDGSGNNFKIERSVRAGTYYIKVESYRSYTGSYTIRTHFREQSPQRVAESPAVGNDDHSNARSGATSLSLGSWRSGQIRPGSDVDYFRVQVSKSGVLGVYTTGNIDTRGTLQNSSGTVLTDNDDDGSDSNFKIERSVRAGTYYIKVESYRSYTGGYTIHTSFREQSPQRVAESSSVRTQGSRRGSSPSPPSVRNNDHSNTRSGATSLSVGGSRSGRIEPGSDVDYFKILVSRSGVLTVYTTGNIDTRGVLQNSSGTALTDDDDDGSGNNFKIERSVSSGTYYIKVESYKETTGSYTIHTNFSDQSSNPLAARSPSVRTPDSRQRSSSSSVSRNDDHSNTRSGATSLALGRGRSRSGQVNPGSDVDYFKVQVSRSGVLTVYTTGNLDTKGTLQNSSGTTVIGNNNSGSGNNFKIEWAVTSGTYYIKVESYGSSTGNYTIRTSFR